MKTGVAGSLVVCALTVSVHAAAGVQIATKTTSSGGGGGRAGALSDRTSQVRLEATRMRTDSTDASGRKQIVVFDGARQVLDTIDEAKKTYTEMTKQDVDRMGARMSDAMAEMRKRLATVPPEQRAKMEAAMKGRLGGAGATAAAKVQYKKTGTATVGKWKCDTYEGFQDGRKTSEVCAADARALGLTDSDFKVARQFAAFFSQMLPAGAVQPFTVGSMADQGFSGVPVRRMFTIAGREIVTEITEVNRQTFPDSIFAVPAGFQKQVLPEVGRGR